MMKTMKLLPLVAALLLAGCATALPELPPQPAPPVQFKEAARWTTAGSQLRPRTLSGLFLPGSLMV